MEYLVTRTSTMEVSAIIDADNPQAAAAKFDQLHKAAAPIVLETTPYPGLTIVFEPLSQAVWDSQAEDDEPVWEVDL